MLYHNVQVMARTLRFVDAAAAAASSTAFIWAGLHALGIDPSIHVQAIKVFVLTYFLAFLVIGERLHIYFARRTEDLAHELFAVGEVTLYAGCIAVVASEIWGGGLPAASYLEGLASALFVLPGLRLAMRFTIRRLRRRGDDYRVWLIVGHNDRAAEIAETVLANPHFGIHIEEIINVVQKDDACPGIPARFERAPLSSLNHRLVPSLEAVREILQTKVIDEVVVTLPVRSCYDRIRELLDICCEAGISVKLDSDVFEKPGFSTELSPVGGIPMITHFSGPSNYRLLTVKRIVDVVGAGIGLLVLSPLLVAVGIAVKLTSPGPMLFFQTRVGLHGRHFRMVKFRSMVRDALCMRTEMAALNERDGTAFKVRNDARITPLGRWLRKYHLDELPQLWNVLVGDMSLVGPRPLPVSEAFGDEWWQRRRLTMPPGLTCFWQLEDDPMIPFKKWMELDMAYIDRWSVWLDFKLIALTVGTVMRGNGW